MSTQIEKLCSDQSLNKKGQGLISDKTLIKENEFKPKIYRVEIIAPLKSIDSNIANVRNYINLKKDKKIIYDIKSLLNFDGEVLTIDELPIESPKDEDSYFLMNRPNDLQQQIRFGSLKKEIGFKEDIKEIVKYQFNDPFHRVLIHIDETKDENIFKVIMFDPFHHVALGLEGRRKLYWNYNRCSDRQNGKHDCISKIL